MTPSYKIAVLKPASHDVQEQFDYIRQRSPIGAEAWYEAYLAALERLKLDPLGPGAAPENYHVEDDVRQVLFTTRRGLPYRIIYTVVGNEVRILRVRGPGQDLLRPQELS